MQVHQKLALTITYDLINLTRIFLELKIKCLQLFGKISRTSEKKSACDQDWQPVLVVSSKKWLLAHFSLLPAECIPRTRRFPTNPFTILELQNASQDVPALHKFCRSPVREALKLWKCLSGCLQWFPDFFVLWTQPWMICVSGNSKISKAYRNLRAFMSKGNKCQYVTKMD